MTWDHFHTIPSSQVIPRPISHSSQNQDSESLHWSIWIVFEWLILGRTGFTWDISTTICPHQMAAVGFEPMTLGFWGMDPTDCTIDAYPRHMTYNLQPTPTFKQYSGHCKSVIDYVPVSRALMDADMTQPVSSWSSAVIWQTKTGSNHRFLWVNCDAMAYQKCGPIWSLLQVYISCT